MTYLIAKFNNFFMKKSEKDPVFTFFFETSARDKKRVYSRALKGAQKDQEKTLQAAKLKKN